jgi:uncharacterized repeat protein (TIGR02543 family)
MRLLGLLLSIPVVGLSTQAAVQQLTIHLEGSGSVLRNPSLTSYPKGATVTLTAVPAVGWKFSAWSGDASGAVNPLNLFMDTDKVLTAHFVPKPTFSLSVQTQGSGAVDVLSGSYAEETLLSARATPANGWVFVGWSGDVTGTNNPLPFLVLSNASITAMFAAPPRITVQPVNTTVASGKTATFHAETFGSSPKSIQWFFNNAPLPSSGFPDLVIPSASTADDGDYFLVVSNAYGVAQSDTVHLSVTGDCSGPAAFKVCDEPSLREAVERGGLIQFCCNGTITLTRTLEITKDVGLDARNQAVVLDGADLVRLVRVHPGVRFAATNLNFTRGYHQGSPGLDGSAEAKPVPGGDGEGGALFNDGGIVTLLQCTFTKNRVAGGTGPVDSYFGPTRDEARPGQGNGGAILNRGGELVAINSSFSKNTARDGQAAALPVGGFIPRGAEARGGAIYSRDGGMVLLSNVYVTACSATVAALSWGHAKGGALYLEDGVLTIEKSILSDNVSMADPAEFLAFSSRPAPASAGAIFAAGGRLTVRRTEVSNNKAQGSLGARHSGTGAGAGGGIFSAGDCLIVESTIRFNKALAGTFSSVNADGSGGGLYSIGKAVVLGSTFHSNQAAGGDSGSFGTIFPDYPPGNGFGGGIWNSGELSVTNSTLALNRASGGARVGLKHPSGDALGGGIFNTNGTVYLMNVSLGSNQAISIESNFETPLPGATLGGNLCNASGTLSLRNTLLAHGEEGGNGAGSLTDAGFNMSSDASCSFASGTSFNLTDPRVLGLADNGGPTPTLALDRDSPAIDFGTTIGAPSLDQRGRPRPTGASGDIGAFERGLEAEAVAIRLSVEGTSGEIRFQASAGVHYELFRSADLQQWERILVRPAGTEAHAAAIPIVLDGQHHLFYRLEAVVP